VPPQEESWASAYERLRTAALGLQGAATADRVGLVVLRRQGMAGWIEARRCCARAAPASSTPRSGQVTGGCSAQGGTHAALVDILANMALIGLSQAEAK